MVAVVVMRTSAVLSTASTLPNNICMRSMEVPCWEMIMTHAASDRVNMPVKLASSLMAVRRVSAPAVDDFQQMTGGGFVDGVEGFIEQDKGGVLDK